MRAAAVAARQEGRISLMQAREAGLTDDQMDRARRGGRLVAVARGVSAFAPVRSGPLADVWTAVLAVGRDRAPSLAERLHAETGITRTCAAGEAHAPAGTWPQDGVGRVAPLVGDA